MDKIVTSFGEEALARRKAMLKTAFGPVIAEALADPHVVEVMVNPDGRLWLDRLDKGRADSGTVLQWSEVERIIRLVASHIRLEVHDRSPIVSAGLLEGRTAPSAQNDNWAMDFVHDQLFDATKVLELTIVDTFTKLSPAI
jgi:Flp pilus assembly CpaF family ATPase